MTCTGCQAAAARMAEMEDELAAWRATETRALESEADALRLHRWRGRLGRVLPNVVRVLIHLADARGRIVPFERIAALGGRAVLDLASPKDLAANSICHARGALRRLEPGERGLADSLQTVRLFGYRLDPEAGERLRTLMGDFEGGRIEAGWIEGGP